MAAGQMWEYTAFLATGVILAAPTDTFVYEVNGFNPSATDLFFQFSQAAAASPGVTVPKQSFSVPAGAEFSWAPLSPWKVTQGLRFYVSTTGNVITPSAQQFWVWARGREQ